MVRKSSVYLLIFATLYSISSSICHQKKVVFFSVAISRFPLQSFPGRPEA